MPAKSFLELMQWGPLGWLDEMTFGTGLTLAVAVVGFLFGLLRGLGFRRIGGGRGWFQRSSPDKQGRKINPDS